MYLKKAGTVLVAVSILIWASMTFPTLDPEQAAPLETQIAALQEVVGGADVFSCHTAKLLREIEVIAPELIEIGHPMGVYKAIDPHPYFGAIVTRCGVEYLENIQKQTRDE